MANTQPTMDEKHKYLELIRHDKNEIKNIPSDLKNDWDFFMELSWYVDAYPFASDFLKNDKDFIIGMCEQSFVQLKDIPEHLRNKRCVFDSAINSLNRHIKKLLSDTQNTNRFDNIHNLLFETSMYVPNIFYRAYNVRKDGIYQAKYN